MQIAMRPMTAEEAWNFMLSNHSLYHKLLKNYHASYMDFIPLIDDFKQMFDKETLTDKDIEYYKNLFVNKVYNIKKLQHLDNIFEADVKPKFEQAVKQYLVPLLPSWNAILPKKLEIQCSYGRGSNYWRKSDDVALMLFRMSRYPDDATKFLGIMFHEFVHMLIEKPIIQKYKVPQDLKERIVDLICYECIKRPVQPPYENSFANTYITPETIKTDLPGAVQKMMADYIPLQQKQISTVRKH